MNYEKVIFVSKSDTSRGPLAAALLNKKLGDEILIESRGMVVLFPEPMNPKTVAIAASKGIDFEGHTSRALSNEDFGREVLVLVMDDAGKKAIYDEFEDAVNVYTIKEFIGEQGSVIDPYGGELPDYAKVYDELEQLTYKLVTKIKYDEVEV